MKKIRWCVSLIILIMMISAAACASKENSSVDDGNDAAVNVTQPGEANDKVEAEDNGQEDGSGNQSDADTAGTEDSGQETDSSTLDNRSDNVEDEGVGQESEDGSMAGNDKNNELSTFVEKHGALHVEGRNLTDEHGETVQLYGMSTHGIAWFPQYVNKDAFRTLRDDWNTNCVRLAMYTEEYGGYCSGGDREGLKELVKNGVDYATELGMYVIIDWHILSDQNPNVHKQDAIEFFEEMSEHFKDHNNVLYEICNEPNGSGDWASIKSYAAEVIPVIRSNDSDAVIIVGTPTWSQEIDKALSDPIDEENIMYTLHFYAATHTEWLRDRLVNCAEQGLPVFVSEFGMCDASGNGGLDLDQSQKWLDLLDEYKISYFCWNLANKAESSSVFKADSSRNSDWTQEDLSESGKWIREHFRNK